jgi:glycosyltransferase involved in cell wall biosynthesis
MPRDPSPRDPLALIGIIRTLVRVRPDVVIMGTPKMGVLGSIAARMARVPTRVYLLHGYRADGLQGRKRAVFRRLEKLACNSATEVVAVSESLRERVVDDGVVCPERVRVLGRGSANGIDLERFRPPSPGEVEASRSRFGLPKVGPVLTFVGRLTHDKGLSELLHVWRSITQLNPTAWLTVAGELDGSDPADRAAVEALRSMPNVRLLGHVDDIERVYKATDVLLLLSKREGLVTVVLEAGACGVPTVAFSVTGVVDTIVSGTTGVLCESGDTEGITRAVSTLLSDANVRKFLGEAAIRFVTQHFQQEAVWDQWEDFLNGVVQEVEPERQGR